MFCRRTICFLGIILLLGGSVFITSHLFVDQEITAKLYFSEIVALVGCVFMAVAALRGRSVVGFDRTGLLVTACLLYVCLRTILWGASGLSGMVPFLCFSFLFFGWHYSPIGLHTTRLVGFFLGFMALAEALFGLWPLIHYVPGVSDFPVIKGSFDNPAGYAACLACLFPWCMYHVLASHKWWRLLWVLMAALVVAGVIASGSRVGMLCVLMVSLWPLIRKVSCLSMWSVRRKLVAVSVAFILVLAALYLLRVDSAQGRLLIWRCSAGLMKDHLLFGAGSHGFQANYMLYQAAYFEANPDSSLAILADNVRHPFNEFVEIVSDYGLVGLLLLELLCSRVLWVCLIRFRDDQYPALLSIFCVFLFSCFSYPFRYSFVWILTAWSLSILVKGENRMFFIEGFPKKILLTVFGLISLFLMLFCVHRMKAEMDWNVVAHQSGETEAEMREYERLDRVLGKAPHFLYNYGAELYQAGRYERSLAVLRRCSRGLNDMDVQMLLAMNFVSLGQADSAESAFMLASRMCPNRFAPWIGLMRLYAASNRMDEAKEMARTVLNKKIKVPSARVLLLIREARRFLEVDVNGPMRNPTP